MESANQPVSKASLWSGRIVSALIILFMLVDGGAKLAKLAPYVQGTMRVGFAANLVAPLGIVEWFARSSTPFRKRPFSERSC